VTSGPRQARSLMDWSADGQFLLYRVTNEKASSRRTVNGLPINRMTPDASRSTCNLSGEPERERRSPPMEADEHAGARMEKSCSMSGWMAD
jgi:hypothetical protein